MNTASKVTLAILVFVGIMGLWVMGNYNSLITSKAQVDKSWAKVETQYQRRMDLVDNIVASVKGAQKQEIAVFSKIADARTAYNSAGNTNDKVNAMSSVETNVALLPRLQEAYPELKSNAQVQSLMDQLEKTEDTIATNRDAYNATVTNYNVGITRFPKSLFAGMFGFDKATLFKSAQGSEKAVKVQF